MSRSSYRENDLMQLMVHLTSLQMQEIERLKKQPPKTELPNTGSSSNSSPARMPASPIESEIEFTNNMLSRKFDDANNLEQQRNPRPRNLAHSGTVFTRRSFLPASTRPAGTNYLSLSRSPAVPHHSFRLENSHNSSFSTISENTVIESPRRYAVTPSSMGSSSSSRSSCSSRVVTPVALSTCTTGHYCGRSAVVVTSFRAKESNEMDLHLDTVVTDIEQWSTHWWFGVRGNQEGLFPSNHVLLI